MKTYVFSQKCWRHNIYSEFLKIAPLEMQKNNPQKCWTYVSNVMLKFYALDFLPLIMHWLLTCNHSMTVSFMIYLGDVINVYDKQMDGWWQGEKNGQVGIFPASYVEEIWPLPFNHPASKQVLVPLAENWLYGKFQHISGGKWTFGQTLVTMVTSEFWMLKTGHGPRTIVYQPIL